MRKFPNLTFPLRLEGHKNAITKLMPIKLSLENKKLKNTEMNLILSSSKDGLFKVWDLMIQDCVATFPGSTNEIWSFEYIESERVILLSSNLEDVQILKLSFENDKFRSDSGILKELEKFQRHSSARVLNMQLDPDGSLLYIISTYSFSFENILIIHFILDGDKGIEIYRLLEEKEVTIFAKNSIHIDFYHQRYKRSLREK